MLDDRVLFTVTDLKQAQFCPRIIFYERCLPHLRPKTYKMTAGGLAHEEEQERAARRSLRAYAVAEGQRFFEVSLTSRTLPLTGILDEAVQTAEGEWFPVDYKLTRKVGANHRVQIAAYGLLLEEQTGVPVQRGFVYLITTRQAVEVRLTANLRDKVKALLGYVDTIVRDELMPPMPKNRAPCGACEFRRFCNDVI